MHLEMMEKTPVNHVFATQLMHESTTKGTYDEIHLQLQLQIVLKSTLIIDGVRIMGKMPFINTD